ncbi:unnamed protein product [Tuber melanosporum]|uniref:(Perigord truffle) hypothetical protein n=1 Tax=Tuber melanosporum (strain Mel28) TaxID=656061 RepID=D5G8Z6_TUBMM|nr:uncharacterized protein GSTUM_00004910001 [Tuber melanosporum]CAZ80989.1 unnamed protein product [Tuber melanosporum]
MSEGTDKQETVTGRCHCQAVTYSFAFTGPLAAFYTHEAFIRRQTGFPINLYIPMNADCDFQFPSDSPNLQSFKYGDKTSFFCKTCGTTLFFTKRSWEPPCILAPTIDVLSGKQLSDYVYIQAHIHLSEAGGEVGGIADIIEDGLPHYMEDAGKYLDSETIAMVERPVVDESQVMSEHCQGVPDVLDGRCCCGALRFSIARPPEDYSSDPTLLRWVKPGGKFAASFCFCTSCRTVSGAPLFGWCFTPTKQLRIYPQSTPRLSVYRSSDKSTRRFCASCGATAFFALDSLNNEMWDIAIGLLPLGKFRSGDWCVWKYDGGDQFVDSYIHGWKDGTMSYERNGEDYFRGLVEQVRFGRNRSGLVN